MTGEQREAFTKQAALLEYKSGLDRKAATLRACEICFPADYRAMKETAALYPDGEAFMYEYLEGLIKNGPQSVIEGPRKDAERENAVLHGNAPNGPPMARYERPRREGLAALQYITDHGIALIGAYDTKATINNKEKEGDYKAAFTTDIETIKNLMAGKGDKEGRAKETKIRRFSFIPANHGFLCLDIDVKDGKNGIADLDRLLTSWGKPKEKRPAALRDIPGSFPCYTQTPSGGVHLYFRYTGQPPESGLFSVDYKSIEIKSGAKNLTAPGSVNAEGLPYILHGDLDKAPELYPFIAAKLPRATQEPKKYISMNKKEYGRPSWELIKQWTDKDGRGSGGRNEYAYSLALHAASHDWPENETLDALRGEPYLDGLPEKEIRTAVQSAYRGRRSA